MGTVLSSPAQAEPPNQLKIADLAEVLQLLRRHGYSGTSYYNLGLFLGLTSPTLDIITENNKNDIEVCLRECLKAWLKKADDVVKKGGPTVFSLVSALRKLGENGVADGMLVMEKHPACRILACHTSNQSLVSAQLPQMTALLYSEMHIKETVCVQREEDLILIEIVKAVCIDSNKLEVFAKILLQYSATIQIGNTIMREYRKVYCCNETKDDNAKQDEIYLPPSLTSKFKSMRMKLSFTFDKVELIIKACPPSILDKIKNALIYYSENLKSQVAQCHNTHDILEIVRRNCSLDDIEMLKAIINELEIEEAKVVVQEYSEAIEEFSETELSKCLNEKFSYASPLQCERITIVVDQETDKRTLKDVRRLSANIVHKLAPQNSKHIKLNVIKDKNSFTITCSFPLVLSDELITTALNNIDVLKENKVKRLTIGYCTVYEVKDTSTATTTEIAEYTSSLSTSSGLSKQLMLSLSVQLINSKEEEIMTMKNETESLKKKLDTKNKMLTASIAESDKFKRIAAETKQLLEKKVSHSTESDEENEKLKEIKELLEEQLALFQFEKEEFIQEKFLMETREKRDEEIQLLKLQLASFPKVKEGEEESFAEEIKKLQSATDEDEMRDKIVQGLVSQNGKLIGKLSVTEKLMEQLQKELKQKDQIMQQEQAERKKEIELLQEKITTMNLKKIERNKQVQEKEETLMLKYENLRKSKDNLIFEDDVYGDITIDNPLIIKILQTRQFQRLKDIKKLGYIYQNIQKSTYSRLEHSIGMYFLAGEYVKQLQQRQPELNITDSDVLCVQIAALCYNLGHGPFSHIFGLFLDEVFKYGDKPWEKVSEASVMMFDHMIAENDEVKNLLEECLENYEEDIAFIKELIHGTYKGKHKGKEFLHEIVVNKTSGLDVCMIDYTIHDAAALGMNISFEWRVFLSKVVVMKCENDERHIFFLQDDLRKYNDLFQTRYTLHREFYYLRKNRIVAQMIKRILVKSNKRAIIKDGDRLVTMSEATKSMSAFTQLDDSILKAHDDDPEVQALLNCLDSKKSIGQIGFIVSTSDWHKERIKQHIVQSTKSCDITDQVVIDPIINGYEDYESITQYYYTSDGRTGQWTHEWALPPPTAYKAPLRIFLVSGDMNLIHEVQEVLQNLQTNEQLNGETYSDQDNYNLMPPLETTEAKALEAQDNDK